MKLFVFKCVHCQKDNECSLDIFSNGMGKSNISGSESLGKFGIFMGGIAGIAGAMSGRFPKGINVKCNHCNQNNIIEL